MFRAKIAMVLYRCHCLIGAINDKFNKKYPPQIQSKLAVLQELVGKLQQVWSEMAGRNLMADIVRLLESFKLQLPNDLQPICLDTSKFVKKVLATHDPTRSRYKNVLCFGYRVRTSGDAYSGKTDDWLDMQERCTKMTQAIQRAYTLAAQNGGNYNSDNEMLKIFMAPEFFFRGKNGAYDFDDVYGVFGRNAQPGIQQVIAKQGILDLMLQEIGKPAYKDWLFVLGTAIAANKLERTVCTVNHDHKIAFRPVPNSPNRAPVCTVDNSHATGVAVDGAMVENVAFVVKEKQVHEVRKELVSGVDYKSDGRPNYQVTVRGEDLDLVLKGPGRADPHEDDPKFSDERMGGSVFNLDGITFGLEICLDHHIRWQTLQAGNGRLENAANIQIQLIPSAGMTIGKLRTVTNGIVFNVDGVTPHVQIVGTPEGQGNDPLSEVRHDFFYENTNSSHELKTKKKFDQISDIDFFDAPNQWKEVTNKLKYSTRKDNAPQVINGPAGSVLMYGPYVIPRV
jgi:hypothetical protein